MNQFLQVLFVILPVFSSPATPASIIAMYVSIFFLLRQYLKTDHQSCGEKYFQTLVLTIMSGVLVNFIWVYPSLLIYDCLLKWKLGHWIGTLTNCLSLLNICFIKQFIWKDKTLLENVPSNECDSPVRPKRRISQREIQDLQKVCKCLSQTLIGEKRCNRK